MRRTHRLRAYPDAVSQPVIILGRPFDTRWASLVLRVAVGVVFVVSGLAKVVDIDGTIRSVRAYRLLPEAVIPTVGSALPVLELALAVLLVSGLLTRVAAGITMLLSTAFVIGISSAWARGLTIECGCFGNNGLASHPVPGYVRELVINALMLLACGWLLGRPASRWSLDGVLGLHPVDLESFDPDPDLDIDTDVDTDVDTIPDPAAEPEETSSSIGAEK
jgi:uncharacterized membrane protein YphA (DoxX/SURF4 family)